MPNCPYMEMNLPRCSGSLSVGHIDEAFNLCVDQYEVCPLYIELSQMASACEAAAPSCGKDQSPTDRA